MARENQGLQIALIIFVMLTLILGVTTFIFFRQYEEAEIAAVEAQARANEADSGQHRTQEENNQLKELMGFAATMKYDDIKAKHKDDMDTYASAYPEESQFYHPVLEYLAGTIGDREEEVKTTKTEIQEWKDKYAIREQSKDPQISQFLAASKQAGDDLAKVTADYKTRRNATLGDQAKIQGMLQKARKDATVRITRVEGELEEAGQRLQKLATLNKQKSAKLDDIIKETFEVPDGEIRWVNQRNRTVWINLGQSDALSRQTTFAVYPLDTTNLTSGGKKASIEVTQILGPHTAEARIIDDSITDPIMPGDKIHTPVWTPGAQKRFALAGLIDIDGNGKTDQHTVRNLITMNGGVVDCETDPVSGKRMGAMTVNTRYIVLGAAPDEKSSPALREGYSRMIGEADRLGVKKMSLDELLQQMGWKNQSPVVTYGRGADPRDFRAKPPEGVPKASTGNVSDVFKRRKPPGSTTSGRGSVY